MSVKDLILAADDRPTKVIQVKEWGVSVHIHTMSGAERDAWEVSIFTGPEAEHRRENIRAKLIVQTLYDAETGQKIFTAEDVEKVGGKSAKVLDRLYDIAAKLNGIREGDLKELEKNS